MTLLNINLFWFNFSRVYNRKLLEFHLPQFRTSSLVARSGLLARADASAARNEWPEMLFAASPRKGVRSLCKVLLIVVVVRKVPFFNLKTGSFLQGAVSFFNLIKAFTGQ
jgi:hypothetical protein